MGGGKAVAANERTTGRRRGPSQSGAANGAAMKNSVLMDTKCLDDYALRMILECHGCCDCTINSTGLPLCSISMPEGPSSCFL